MPKRTKSTKVTDNTKAWNRKGKPSGYRIDSIAQNLTILIVCEGQTEKLYFEAFPVLGARVKVVDLKGQSKLKLVEATHEIVAQANNEFDIVWCVFDMDVKAGGKEFADFDNSIEKAQKLDYKVAYSNDSFELWFYLNYGFTDSRNHRTFYYSELGKRFGLNYAKEGKKYHFCSRIYEILKQDLNSSQQKAAERATELYVRQQHLPFHQQNPVTKVYELVECLNENQRR